MTFILGLTGSVGMGKSTTSRIFRELGVPVWDADATVHALYDSGGAAVAPVGQLCPAAQVDGRIDRSVLKNWLVTAPDGFRRLEQIVHPLVAQDRQAFIRSHTAKQTPLVVLDIPLLFENDGDQLCDATLVVTADPEEQRRRVLERPGMTEEEFERINQRQMPDNQKRQRATFVVETLSVQQTREDVQKIIKQILGR